MKIHYALKDISFGNNEPQYFHSLDINNMVIDSMTSAINLYYQTGEMREGGVMTESRLIICDEIARFAIYELIDGRYKCVFKRLKIKHGK